jgi:pellino protein
MDNFMEWTSRDVAKWLKSLPMLHPSNERIARVVERECISGKILIQHIDHMAFEWEAWKLEPRHFFLLRNVVRAWDGTGLPRLLSSTTTTTTLRLLPANVPAGVASGVVADLSECNEDMARALVAADEQCVASAVGYIYGQLVVLGHSQYNVEEPSSSGGGGGMASDAFQPVGWSNERFVLRRRRVPNGVRLAPPPPHNLRDGPFTESDIVYECRSDPTRDVYQVGRAEDNDVVVKGPVRYSRANPGLCSGSVSRYACRVECDRLPPYRAFIYAGGLDAEGNLAVGDGAAVWCDEHDDDCGGGGGGDPAARFASFDAVTTYGVRLWHPLTQTWTEISVNGHAYAARQHAGDGAGPPLGPPHTNELVDGCIVDLCGVAFEYQSPVTMAAALRGHVAPSSVIQRLNALKPQVPRLLFGEVLTRTRSHGPPFSFRHLVCAQCPVLLSAITFSHLTDSERAQRAADRAERGASFLSVGPMPIPATDYEHIEEGRRSYVFPACGHVQGYHRSLQGRPCPLCRRPGPLVPLAFAFCASVCASPSPTHVFNPCGHVASQRVCERWASVPLFGPAAFPPQPRPHCPFCATALDAEQPFSRLILQTEAGRDSNIDDGEGAARGVPMEVDDAGPDAAAAAARACWEIYCHEAAELSVEGAGEGETMDTDQGSGVAMSFPKWTPQLMR